MLKFHKQINRFPQQIAVLIYETIIPLLSGKKNKKTKLISLNILKHLIRLEVINKNNFKATWNSLVAFLTEPDEDIQISTAKSIQKFAEELCDLPVQPNFITEVYSVIKKVKKETLKVKGKSWISL